MSPLVNLLPVLVHNNVQTARLFCCQLVGVLDARQRVRHGDFVDKTQIPSKICTVLTFFFSFFWWMCRSRSG